MKRILHLSGLLVAFLLVCFSQRASASHFQGGDLTYACVAPGVYTVNLKLYRDCTGSPAPNSADLDIKSPGCNNGRSVTLNKVGGNRIGDPYCASIPKTCGTQRVNYEEVTFTTTLIFSTAEQTCNIWHLSWSECCRPNTANLVGQDDPWQEAMVNIAAGINNNSPEFGTLNVPIPFVCHNMPIIYSMNASEQDGDSLVYSLEAPWDASNSPIPTKPYQGGGGISIPGLPPGVIINPNPKAPYSINPFVPQFAYIASGGPTPTNYTPTMPMPSLNINWSGKPTYNHPSLGMIWEGTNQFVLDPASGEIKFTPSRFVPGATPASGENKYAVVVKVSEYREINGVWTLVGWIRRDILFVVEDCGGNRGPNETPKPIDKKFKATVEDTLFQVQACNTTRVVLQYIDSLDNVKISIDSTQYLKDAASATPKIRVYDNNTDTVSVVLWITPLITDAGKKYFLPIKIEDDACPIKFIETRVYSINVAKENLAKLSTTDSVRTICLGESTRLDVILERPDSVLLAPTTYNYKWNAAPGLNPGDANKSSVVVTPTQTTRYKVLVENSVLGGCYDTTSILVKVVPLPIISDVKVGPGPNDSYEIPFGKSAQLTTVMGNASTKGYKYSWAPGKGLSDSTIANPIANPLRTTNYTLTVADSAGNCISTKVVNVKVAPFTLPNIITPNNDGKNDAFLFLGIQPNTSLKIFNRWGVLVKEYSSYDNSFKGEGVADGTYYYIIQEPSSLPNAKSFKGWFEIVRD